MAKVDTQLTTNMIDHIKQHYEKESYFSRKIYPLYTTAKKMYSEHFQKNYCLFLYYFRVWLG